MVAFFRFVRSQLPLPLPPTMPPNPCAFLPKATVHQSFKIVQALL